MFLTESIVCIYQLHILTVEAIKTQGLTKSYDGFSAVRGIDMTVTEGSLHGLIGPNGAGKTTIIKMLTCLAAPSAGAAWIRGFDILTESGKVKESIGYLAEQSYLYEDMEVGEYLRFFGNIYGMDHSARDERITELTGELDIADRLDSGISTLSKGLRRRVAICRALLHDPSILIMDEVTSGLDPVSSRQIRKYLKSLPEQGKTVLLSTHDLYEADILCDEATILSKGRIIAQGSRAQMEERLSPEGDGPLFERIFFKALEVADGG